MITRGYLLRVALVSSIFVGMSGIFMGAWMLLSDGSFASSYAAINFVVGGWCASIGTVGLIVEMSK